MPQAKPKKNTEKVGISNLMGVHECLYIDPKEDQIVIINHEHFGDEMPSKGKALKSLNESLRAIGYEDDNKINKAEFAWVRRNNSFFVSAKPNTEEIPAGLYDIRSSMELGLYLERRSVILDELFMPPDVKMEDIVADLKKFWESRAKYDEYGFTYKRGILTYGPPGSGKTSLLNLLIHTVVNDHNGLVLNMDCIDTFITMGHNIRALEPNKPILAIIEDLDSFLSYNSTKQFLNLLDGNLQIDNIVYLATTNYLERLEDRIKNRPSRFDKRYEIGYPSDQCREFYFKSKLKPEDLAKLGDNGLQKWVNDTKQFTYSHLRELICSVIVMDNEYEKTIKQLRELYPEAQ